VLRTRVGAAGYPLALVPVAAVLVASIRLHAINVLMHLGWSGPHEITSAQSFKKGEELGWFEHGSTIIVFAPKGFQLAQGITSGQRIRMGQPLMHLPD
jgi:phosphatidylserine decarboxylase